MKREIKFRGKRLDNGEWLYGDLMHDNHGGCYIYPLDAKNLCTENKVSPDTIGQFAGLYDKNGMEIYEGDLLSIGEYRYVCEFVDGGFEFRDKKDNLLIVKCIVHHTEVIGNIYDNKDLL